MENKQIKAILIHGNGGSTVKDHWLPSVESGLTQLGVHVVARTFPDNMLARKKIWLSFLENELRADNNTILIGHSSGAEAAMRFVEKHKILGSVLVSPCYTDTGIMSEKMSGWYDDPWDFATIIKNQKWIVQFSSIDDPLVPIMEQRYVRDHLHTDYHEFRDRGHFISRDTLPELIEAVKGKLGGNE